MSGTNTDLTSVTWTNQLLGYRMAVINVGDTLKKIALRETGDASQWVTLANVNNLQPPYIVDNLAQVTGPGILVAGQQLMIPAPTTVQTGVTDETDLLGVDLLLTGGMLTDDGGGDIQTVSGLGNLQQALEAALITRKQELIYHPDYGCDVYDLLGKGNGPVPMQLAGAYVGSTLASDQRVQEVDNVVATATGDNITVTAQVIPISGKPLPVGATIGS